MSDEQCAGETLIEHFERCVPGGREALAKARREMQLRSQVPKLVGAQEAAVILGVRPSRVYSLRTKHPLFPEPIEELKCGPIWLEREIVKFSKIPRPVGRPRKVRGPVD